MRPLPHFVVVLAMLAGAAARPILSRAAGWDGDGEVIDRVVAVVNSHAILDSELDESLRYQELWAGRPPGESGEQERAAALERLIDQSLIEQHMEMTHFAGVDREQAKEQIADMRRQLAPAASDQAWQQRLAGYGLSPEDLERLVALQLNLLRFIDVRFRNNVRIDPAMIEGYYRQTLLPELRREGAREAPLSEVSDKIEKVLVEQRVNQMLASWLQSLRGQSHIQRLISGGTAQQAMAP